MFFFKMKPKRTKAQKVDDKRILGTMRGELHNELSGYLKREELRDYLAKIQKDDSRKQLWESLSTQKKIKLLRYVLEKKGAERGKK